jgi:hypothetical protein
MAQEPGDRYEPFPGLTKIPGWVWRRLGRAGRIALGLFALALVVATALLIPHLSDVRRENRQADRLERASALAAEIKRVNAIQRPRTGATVRDPPGAPAADRRRTRSAALRALKTRILADSRGRRGLTRAKRVQCRGPSDEPPAERALSQSSGRYACTAVTSRVVNADGNTSYGITGYPYRAVITFPSGRLTWCKVVGRAGEGSLYSRNPTPVPRVCTG